MTTLSPLQRAAYQEIVRRRLTIRQEAAARPASSLSEFCEATLPGVRLEAWQQQVCRRLEQMLHQEGQRLLIHGPPQFGKSVIISQRFPAWLLSQRPEYRMRLACYNVTHAARFSRVNRELLRSRDYAHLFPAGCRLEDKQLEDEWSTAARAALRDGQPSFKALGIRGGFTGLGAELLVIDDPYSGQDEAFSEAVNEGVWSWWTTDARPRLNPRTNVVVMFHRYSEDDLAGRLYAEGDWELMRFPAIADGEEGDCSGLPEGTPLSPRYSVEHLRAIEEKGPSQFLALFQGRPVPAGGNLFKRDWFTRRYRDLAGVKEVWVTWDTALKESEANAQSAYVIWALKENGDICPMDAGRGHWETPDVEHLFIEQADWLIATFGEKFRGVYVEDKASGTTLVRYIRRSRPDLAIIPVPAENDKVARAKGVTPICEAGRVVLPDYAIYPEAREWCEDLLVQICSFPAGKFKDLTDAWVYGLMRVMGTIGKRKSRRGKGGGYA